MTSVGRGSVLVYCVMHTGGVLDVPVVSVTRGADSGFFVAGFDTGLSNAGIEWWVIDPVTEAGSTATTVNFDTGVSVSVIVWGFEVFGYNINNIGDYAGVGGITVTADSASVTPGAVIGGYKSTVVLPGDMALIMAAGGAFSALGSVAATTGTSQGTLSVGSGGTRIVLCVTLMNGTGGGASDTFAFTFPVSEYGIIGMSLETQVVAGPLYCCGVIPQIK